MQGFPQCKRRLGLACILFCLLCTPAPAQDELGFAERVEAQRAIEAVHYAHRLQANRSFDDAVPAELLERKVRTYLKQSVLLEHRWNTPVTAAALQAELRRIADATLLPQRLEEIYAALDNDTKLIEETFARATLVDRLARSFFSADQEIHAAARAEAERIRRDLDSGALDARAEHPRRVVHEIHKEDPSAREAARLKVHSNRRRVEPIQEGRDSFVISETLDEGVGATRAAVYTVPKVTWESWWKGIEPELDESLVQAVAAPDAAPPAPHSIEQSKSVAASTCHPPGQWINGSLDDGLLTPRFGHTAVWTGQLMLVWGGYGGGANPYPPGERYNPLTDAWSPISTVNEPTFHENHTAVWTGTEMIVWGGGTNTGGRYDPIADTWAQVSTAGAPSPRQGHTAVWTGSRMVIWGGSTVADGALYNPATNTWSPMATAQAPAARSGHTATWTGSVMVVWGGVGGGTWLNTGGRYDPASNTWSLITTHKAPTARYEHTAVWTGSRVIVWGGLDSSTLMNDGGLYDPVTNAWDPTPTTGAPAARNQHTAVWTGTEMIVWGGFSDTGGRYDPAAGVWRTVTRVNGPATRTAHSAVWTGSLMIIWGGMDDGGESILSTGARYDPAIDVWTPVSAPGGQGSPITIWTGNHMIVWGGYGDNGAPVNSGGRYDPLTDVWAPTSLTGAPAPRTRHTAVWTGSEMIVWGGFSGASDLASGGRYDPVTDVWAPTSLPGAPAARSSHTAVWTSSRMIVWGGSASSTGGLYDPTTDTWSPTSLVNAPIPRVRPATVWTGREMIIWGGISNNTYLTSGGRYDPVADTWLPTSMVSTPPGRFNQGAVWTGSLMVVWGGSNGSGDPLTGGRYHPDTDTWRPMSPSGTLSYIGYEGVWTGTVLILWGAFSGATYHPYLDTWTPLPAAGAPHFLGESAVWDGEGMILWGVSYFASSYGEDAGARYVLAPDTSQDTDADGFTVCAGDCNDADSRVRPGAPQTCDGLNNDCGHPFWPSLTATNETYDGDGDARSACLDCNDADASAWGTPTDTTDLTLTGPEPVSLSWAPPTTPGAMAIRYDTLRSGGAADFGVAAVCVESDDGGNAFAVDPAIPAAGSAFYYLVRAENGCPGTLGVGPLGIDSHGQARSGRTCP